MYLPLTIHHLASHFSLLFFFFFQILFLQITSWPLSSNSQTLKMLGKKCLEKGTSFFRKYSQTVWTPILACCPTQRLNSGINSAQNLLNQLSSNFQAVQRAPLTCPDKFLDLAQSEIFHLASNWNTSFWSEYCTVYLFGWTNWAQTFKQSSEHH